MTDWVFSFAAFKAVLRLLFDRGKIDTPPAIAKGVKIAATLSPPVTLPWRHTIA